MEILGCLERIELLIDDPDIVSPRCRAEAGINNLQGVGVSEAPRGTLFHDYFHLLFWLFSFSRISLIFRSSQFFPYPKTSSA